MVVDDDKGTLRGARNRLPDWQCVQPDAAMLSRFHVQAPAVVVVHDGKATVANDVKANELLSGQRLLPRERFRWLLKREDFDRMAAGEAPCLSGNCPPATTPTPPPPTAGGVGAKPQRRPVKQKPPVADNASKRKAEEMVEAARNEGKQASGCKGKGCNEKKGPFGFLGDIFEKIGEAFKGLVGANA